MMKRFKSDDRNTGKDIEKINYSPQKKYDPLLDIYHNTRHASPRHASIKDKKGWHFRSPWLSRFDWILDTHLEAEYDKENKLYLTKKRKTPRTVFVKTGRLGLFVRRILPTINNKFVLYIGNGDLPLSASGYDIKKLFKHPLIHRVFCENKDIDIDDITAMPVGMHPREILFESSVLNLQQIAAKVNPDTKRNKVFGAWSHKETLFNTRSDREEAKRFMLAHPELCDHHEVLPLQTFWDTMSQYRFMFSPWGNTYDSAKTFEALILKTIPIIMAGPYTEAYRDLPVVVIRSLEEITGENLQRWWESLSGKFENMSFVSADYWWNKVERALPVKKKAFLVLGPESHGNHLVTDLLTHAGCHGQSGEHISWHEDCRKEASNDVQPWDKALPDDQDPIVWRRSVPHLTSWPDIKGMVDLLEKRDYQVTAVVTTRDRYAALQSQLKWQHVADIETGKSNIEKAYKHIFSHLQKANIPYILANYESLVNYAQARDFLLQELELELPPERFPVWDGNEKWYKEFQPAKTGKQEKRERALINASSADFPESWFSCYDREYERRIVLGKRRMRTSRVVFSGLARNVRDNLTIVSERIESAAAMFHDYRVVIYENDSQDATLEYLQTWQQKNPNVVVLNDTLQAPDWEHTRDRKRMVHMAACRNRYLSYIEEHYEDFDYVIVLDTDLPKGFSYEGLANTFGHDDWHVVGSNGLLVPAHGKPPPNPMFFDAWAFRSEGDNEAQPFEAINHLQFHRGDPLLPVWSCFGGLAVYQMACIRSGARYGGEDCEHVVFHRQLRERGFDRQFLNPSQIVLYSGKEP